MHIVGLFDKKEDADEIKLIAKLVVIGNRARELSQKVNK